MENNCAAATLAYVLAIAAFQPSCAAAVSKAVVIGARSSSSLDCILLPNSTFWSATTTLRWIKGETTILADYLLGEVYASVSPASRLIAYENATSGLGSISSAVDADFQGGVNFKLLLTNTNAMIEGTYNCMAVVKSTAEQTSIVSYNVAALGQPRNVRTNITGQHFARQGDSILISCSSDGQPAAQYRWTNKDDREIAGASVNNGSYAYTVVSIYVSRSVVGAISCIAFNAFGSTTSSFVLTLLAPPVVTSASETLRVKSGGSATMTCQVLDQTRSTQSSGWLRIGSDGESDVQEGTRVAIAKELKSDEVKLMKLTVRNIHPGDMGTYQCWSENVWGRDSSTVLMTDEPFDSHMNVTDVRRGSALLVVVTHAMEAVGFFLNVSGNRGQEQDRRKIIVAGRWTRGVPPSDYDSSRKQALELKATHRLTQLKSDFVYQVKLYVLYGSMIKFTTQVHSDHDFMAALNRSAAANTKVSVTFETPPDSDSQNLTPDCGIILLLLVTVLTTRYETGGKTNSC